MTCDATRRSLLICRQCSTPGTGSEQREVDLDEGSELLVECGDLMQGPAAGYFSDVERLSDHGRLKSCLCKRYGCEGTGSVQAACDSG